MKWKDVLEKIKESIAVSLKDKIDNPLTREIIRRKAQIINSMSETET